MTLLLHDVTLKQPRHVFYVYSTYWLLVDTFMGHRFIVEFVKSAVGGPLFFKCTFKPTGFKCLQLGGPTRLDRHSDFVKYVP